MSTVTGNPANTNSNHASDQLRSEISWLGSLLGRVITANTGADSLALVEDIRRLARDRRNGDTEAESKLRETLRGLTGKQMHTVIRAFAIFLDLANAAEDRQRVRVLRSRADQAFPAPYPESISAAISSVRESRGIRGVEEVLKSLELDLVMTAHPTEAKRQTVRRSLTRLRTILESHDQNANERQKSQTETLLLAELTTLWQTDMIRSTPPTVQQEARRSLSAKRAIWNLTADLTRELRAAVQTETPAMVERLRPFIRLGSWVGGDRDGHPYVTCEVTRNTFELLRAEAIRLHLEKCKQLIDSMSLSNRHVSMAPELGEWIHQQCEHFPELRDVLSRVAESELPRRCLRIIRQKLLATAASCQLTPQAGSSPLAYSNAVEFRSDVARLADSLRSGAGKLLADRELQSWLDQIDAFGLHLARLDMRQNSVEYSAAIGEIFMQAGWTKNWSDQSASDQLATVLSRFDETTSRSMLDSLSPATQEVIGLFALLREVAHRFGTDTIGGHVVSMTHHPIDILTVQWFWNQSRYWHAEDAIAKDEDKSPAQVPSDPETTSTSEWELPIIPLFETIEDLHQSAATLEEVLSIPRYRDYLRRLHDRQIVMVGYSDSTKDGGYLAANWALYEGQQQMHAVTSQHGVEVVFFHGRGGSLGRGGGPAARAILSLPSGTFHGAIRMTEQGEVLAERYDDPSIARRHLEQLTWASILAANREQENASEFESMTKLLADAAFRKYRELVEHEHFVQFFQTITPISEIEQLQIGSRPSRRRGKSSLSDLRAIPWVFSWTQTRVMLPAWFGLGSAVRSLARNDQHLVDQLKRAYRTWPYFQAMIDNAELALAKADMQVFRSYQELSESEEESIYLREIAAIIESECERSTQTINTIKEQDRLLEGIHWLSESIRVRNRYIDPLNLIQVELLGRLRGLGPDANETDVQEAQLLARLAIKGIAAGMRTTG